MDLQIIQLEPLSITVAGPYRIFTGFPSRLAITRNPSGFRAFKPIIQLQLFNFPDKLFCMNLYTLILSMRLVFVNRNGQKKYKNLRKNYDKIFGDKDEVVDSGYGGL